MSDKMDLGRLAELRDTTPEVALEIPVPELCQR